MGKRLGIGKRHGASGTRAHGAPGLIGAACALAAALVLSGCTAGAIAPVPSRTPSPSPTPSSTYVAPPPTELAPLRGTTVPAGSLEHASIAAKIDNHPDARPQVGLERTDLVFEELVEGGLTRYVALWQSDIPDLLGPVRSIRPMDPDILSPFAGIVCYSGGQQRFVDLMRHTPVYNAIHGQPDTAATFYRTKDKRAPHNVIVKAKEVLAQHAIIACPRAAVRLRRRRRLGHRGQRRQSYGRRELQFRRRSATAAGPTTRPPSSSSGRRTGMPTWTVPGIS